MACPVRRIDADRKTWQFFHPTLLCCRWWLLTTVQLLKSFTADGAVVGSWRDRGAGKVCCLVLTKKDPHRRRPILTDRATHKTVVQHAGQSLWFSKLKEIISQGCNDIMKELQCCFMIKHSTGDSH